MDEAVTALEDGDRETALLKAQAALALLAVTPDVEHGEHKLRWDRRAISDFVREMQRGISSRLGIQRTNLKFTRPEVSSDA